MKIAIETCCKDPKVECEDCGEPTDLLVDGNRFMCRDCIKTMIDNGDKEVQHEDIN